MLAASAGFAQQTMQAIPVPGPAKDAGVYHIATRTWTRGGQHENLGSKVLYSNLANTGFFGVMGVAADIHWTDEGRIPSTGGHPNAKSDSYLIQGIQIAYCSSVVGGPQTGALDFFECYASCTDPAGLTPAFSAGFSAPGAVSTTSCWIVTFDLKGTTLEFNLAGDCDGTFDGTSALDNFGWTLTLVDGGAGGFNGPLLNGDPNNVPYGDGTYYQNSGATTSTGLGTQDQFWLADQQGGYANGCYWFGGYPSTNQFASFWLVLTGSNQDDSLGTKYCVANYNSTGAPADIAVNAETVGYTYYTFASAPVPNQPSIFFHAANQSQVPFGCSFLCTTGGIVRGAVVTGVNNSAIYTYDGSDAKHSLDAFNGQTRNFQHWYRDPMGNCASGVAFNTSNAVSLVVVNAPPPPPPPCVGFHFTINGKYSYVDASDCPYLRCKFTNSFASPGYYNLTYDLMYIGYSEVVARTITFSDTVNDCVTLSREWVIPQGEGSGGQYYVRRTGTLGGATSYETIDVDYGVFPPLELYYAFDGEPTPPWLDYSGQGHDGQGNAPTRAGVCQEALEFAINGESELWTPHDDSLNMTGDMTGMAWIRPAGPHDDGPDCPDDGLNDCTQGTIFSKGGNYWLQLSCDNTGIWFQNEELSGEYAFLPYEFPIDTWTHVAFVRSNGNHNIRFYINGTLRGDGWINAQPSANGNPITFGSYGWEYDPTKCEFNGQIDEIKIWRGALSDCQVHEEAFNAANCWVP